MFPPILLYSNTPKTPGELRTQFVALCKALDLDPEASNILDMIRDPEKVPWSAITRVIETDTVPIPFGTFRGCLDGTWLPYVPDPMTWQRTGGLAQGLKAYGVRSITVGNLPEEWYLYSIAHPVASSAEISLNLERYYAASMVKGMVDLYKPLPEGASKDNVAQLFGEILSDGQVHLPVRILVRDLINAGFPVLRYSIAWVPDALRTLGQ